MESNSTIVIPPAPIRSRSLRTKAVSLAAGILFTFGFIVWPGCATPPLPSSRTPVASLRRSDVTFAQNAHPTKSEVIAKLGPPDKFFPDIRVACYQLNYLSRRSLILFLGVIPIDVTKENPATEVAMFQFDDHGHMLRSVIQAVNDYQTVIIPKDAGPRLQAEAAVMKKDFSARALEASARKWVNGDALKN